MRVVRSPQDRLGSRGARSRKGFTLIELMIVVTIIGVLASVAIPALMESVRRSKTSEATVNVRRMFDGAVTAYQSEGVDQSGHALLPDFPSTVAATPAENSCCASTAGKCPADSRAFDHPTWHRLGFALDDPHYYWYSFDATGAGASAEFTARANGNLNCDDKYSTFERIGYVDFFGGVTGGAAVYRKDPIE